MKKKSIWCQKWFWCVAVVLLALPFGVGWKATRIPGSEDVKQLEAKLMSLEFPRTDAPTTGGLHANQATQLAQELGVCPVGPLLPDWGWPLLAYSDLGGAWLDCYVGKHGATLEEFSRTGVCVPWADHSVAEVPPSARSMPYVFLARNLATANASIAVRKARLGDWKAAIKRLEAAANAGNGLDELGEWGFGTKLSCYGRAARSLTLIARTDLTLSAALTLKDTARSLRERMPRPSERMFLQLARGWAQDAGGKTHETWATAYSNLAQTRLTLAGLRREWIEPWAASFSPWMPWTSVRGNMAWIRTTLRWDPDMFPNRLGMVEPFSGVDRVTRMLYLNQVGSGMIELTKTVSEVHTMLAVAEVAFAARAFRLENNRWPEFAELHPKYLTEAPDSFGEWQPECVATGDRLFPKSPEATGRFQMATCQIEDKGQYLNLSAGFSQVPGERDGAIGGSTEYDVKLSAAGETPLIGFALVEALKRVYGDKIGQTEVLLHGDLREGERSLSKDEATSMTLSNIQSGYVDCFAGATAAPETPGKRDLVLRVRASVPQTAFAVYILPKATGRDDRVESAGIRVFLE